MSIQVLFANLRSRKLPTSLKTLGGPSNLNFVLLISPLKKEQTTLPHTTYIMYTHL